MLKALTVMIASADHSNFWQVRLKLECYVIFFSSLLKCDSMKCFFICKALAFKGPFDKAGDVNHVEECGNFTAK